MSTRVVWCRVIVRRMSFHFLSDQVGGSSVTQHQSQDEHFYAGFGNLIENFLFLTTLCRDLACVDGTLRAWKVNLPCPEMNRLDSSSWWMNFPFLWPARVIQFSVYVFDWGLNPRRHNPVVKFRFLLDLLETQPFSIRFREHTASWMIMTSHSLQFRNQNNRCYLENKYSKVKLDVVMARGKSTRINKVQMITRADVCRLHLYFMFMYSDVPSSQLQRKTLVAI